MAKYIDKSALVAELKRIEHETNYEPFTGEVLGKRYACKGLLSFLNSLEVKEVEEPTAYDRGMAEEIIINLKRVEQDYNIDLTREMEWIRNKAQKEE